ncbi:T9SS type A sorting domain-containing protein [candidate division KSB1 bacterium]|nr:T9SS type A sorting domain-containing protein [candidate division KSB1 bacterium]
MKSIQTFSMLTLGILFLLLIQFDALAAFSREYEPVITKGADYANFLNVPLSQIHAFAFDQPTNTWHEIPLQIDEMDNNGNYVLLNGGTAKNQLGQYDELVVMAKDAGDRATTSQWINDADSKTYPRYRLRLNDPISSETEFIYVYRSSTFQSTLNADYVDQSQDAIFSETYTLGHDMAGGFITHLGFPNTKGNWGTNLLDRQKMRLNGTYKIGAFPVNYNTSESNFVVKDLHYIDGTVRVIRQMNWLMNVKYGTISVEIPITTLVSKFYLFSTQIASDKTNMKSEYGVNLFRHSFDIKKGIGDMFFSNPYNTDVVLNGTTDTVDRTLDVPGTFWALLSGSQGTMLQIIDMPGALGDTQRLYYCENQTQTDDGTTDTGADGSWGDIGLLCEDNIVGDFYIAPVLYLVPDQQNKSWAEEQIDRFTTPIDVTQAAQTFQGGGATITLSSPNGGEVWMIGASQKVQWSASGVSGDVTIYLSSNSGANWQSIGTATASAGQFSLTVPDVESMNCRMRVTSVSAPSVLDESDADFTIKSSTDRLSIADAEGEPGSGPHKVDVILTNYFNAAGVQINIKQQPQELVFVKAELTSRTSGFVKSVTDHGNYLTILLYNLSGGAISPGFGPILELYFNVAGSSSHGTDIELDPAKVIIADETITVVPVSTKKGVFRIRKASAVDDEDGGAAKIMEYRLSPNYPNPFNAQTVIPYEIPERCQVSLRICNILGQEVRLLVNDTQLPGQYTAIWDGYDKYGHIAGSGVYLIQMQSGKFNKTQKVVLIK